MKMIPQRNRNDCAVACCMMLLREYGIEQSYSILCKSLLQENKNANLYQIKQCFQEHGLNPIMGCCDNKKESLQSLYVPSLLHYHRGSLRHFVILVGYDKKTCLVADPRYLRLHKLSTRRILQLWSGYFLMIPKTPSSIRDKSQFWYYSYQIRLFFLLMVLIVLFIAYFYCLD